MEAIETGKDFPRVCMLEHATLRRLSCCYLLLVGSFDGVFVCCARKTEQLVKINLDIVQRQVYHSVLS
jgi:hypothetical protein